MAAGDSARRSIVLVHSSDLHVDDDLSPARYNGLIGLRAVLDTASSLQADIVLLAGDTFDNARISSRVLGQAADLLAGAPMPVVLLPGNHDPAMDECLYRRAGIIGLNEVHVLGITALDHVVFGELEIEIRGIAHRGFGDMPPLPAATPRRARWQVVMAHGHYVPPEEWLAQSHRAWKISDADIAATSADYVALGHWDRATPAGDGSVPAYYSGSPDLAKTANVIRLAEGAHPHIERAPLVWSD